MNMELIGKALEVCPVKRRFIDMPGPEYYLTALDENGDPFGPAFEWIEEGGLACECQTVFAEDAMTAAWLAWLIGRGCTLDGWGVTLPGDTNRIRENGIIESLAAAVIAVKEAQ